jgi:hypothetical protein
MTPASLPPLLNKRELRALGWTPALILSLLGEPDKQLARKRGFMHWTEHLYSRGRVEADMADARFLALKEKRKLRTEAARARLAAIPGRYAGWREALADAGQRMSQLTRYAKRRRCSAVVKQEIYDLKHQFLEALDRHGYFAPRSFAGAPAQLTKRNLTEAQALVRWVIARAREEEPRDDAVPFEVGMKTCPCSR